MGIFLSTQLNLKEGILYFILLIGKGFRRQVNGGGTFSSSLDFFLEMWMQESSSQQLCSVENLLRAALRGRGSGRRPGTYKLWSGGQKVVFGEDAVFWEVRRGETQLLFWDQERNHGGGETVTWGIWSTQMFKLEHLLQQSRQSITTWQRKNPLYSSS